MARQKAFLKYKDITLYRGLKADGELDFIYTRKRNNYVEGGDGWFEITRLPKKYWRGLDIIPDYSGARAPASAGYMYDIEAFRKINDRKDDAHREVLRRAIDDDYDLEAATRGNYVQLLRRLQRWLRRKLDLA